jgi:hypothetical protein
MGWVRKMMNMMTEGLFDEPKKVFDNLRIDPGVTFHTLSPNRTLSLPGGMVPIPFVGEERAPWQ